MDRNELRADRLVGECQTAGLLIVICAATIAYLGDGLAWWVVATFVALRGLALIGEKI